MLKNKSFVDQTPRFIKNWYVICIQVLRFLLQKIGLLAWLDKRAKQKPHYHYLRSLFAIYQLEDLIQLDVPWWTYSAIQQVEQYLKNLSSLPSVFEYGSGASTVWLAKRAAHVISVEHDQKWYDKLHQHLTDYKNVTLLFAPAEKSVGKTAYQSPKAPQAHFEQYVHTIENIKQQFDIIVIDGRCRATCLKICLPYLKPHGIIIFDNANRDRYQTALQQSALKIDRYRGRVPGSPVASETAILQRVE